MGRCRFPVSAWPLKGHLSQSLLVTCESRSRLPSYYRVAPALLERPGLNSSLTTARACRRSRPCWCFLVFSRAPPKKTDCLLGRPKLSPYGDTQVGSGTEVPLGWCPDELPLAQGGSCGGAGAAALGAAGAPPAAPPAAPPSGTGAGAISVP